MEEQIDQTVPYTQPMKWVDTDWNDQGKVFQLGDKIWYIEILPVGAVQLKSMAISEWEVLPKEEKIGESNVRKARRVTTRRLHAVKRGSSRKRTVRNFRNKSK